METKSGIMLLLFIFLIGRTLAFRTSTAAPDETDGEVSRKILGSSVVTSVSVIMDVGNGSKTYYSDAVGKPVSKPFSASQLASPINLLNPDRYEFYTFDDNGDLVKRLMTLEEIQSIIASGDDEAGNHGSDIWNENEPAKKVDDVVNNVQNVLKEEMAAHKTSTDRKPIFDTAPQISSNWNLILPPIFNNIPDDTDKTTQKATQEFGSTRFDVVSAKTETPDVPKITIKIAPVENKTGDNGIVKKTTSYVYKATTVTPRQTTLNEAIKLKYTTSGFSSTNNDIEADSTVFDPSSLSPFIKLETIPSVPSPFTRPQTTVTPILSTVTYNTAPSNRYYSTTSRPSTLQDLETLSTSYFSKRTNQPLETSSNLPTTQFDELSTFVGDDKEKFTFESDTSGSSSSQFDGTSTPYVTPKGTTNAPSTSNELSTGRTTFVTRYELPTTREDATEDVNKYFDQNYNTKVSFSPEERTTVTQLPETTKLSSTERVYPQERITSAEPTKLSSTERVSPQEERIAFIVTQSPEPTKLSSTEGVSPQEETIAFVVTQSPETTRLSSTERVFPQDKITVTQSPETTKLSSSERVSPQEERITFAVTQSPETTKFNPTERLTTKSVVRETTWPTPAENLFVTSEFLNEQLNETLNEVTEDSSTELHSIDVTTTKPTTGVESFEVTQLLNQILQTTNVFEINSQLLNDITSDEISKEADPIVYDEKASTETEEAPIVFERVSTLNNEKTTTNSFTSTEETVKFDEGANTTQILMTEESVKLSEKDDQSTQVFTSTEENVKLASTTTLDQTTEPFVGDKEYVKFGDATKFEETDLNFENTKQYERIPNPTKIDETTEVLKENGTTAKIDQTTASDDFESTLVTENELRLAINSLISQITNEEGISTTNVEYPTTKRNDIQNDENNEKPTSSPTTNNDFKITTNNILATTERYESDELDSNNVLTTLALEFKTEEPEQIKSTANENLTKETTERISTTRFVTVRTTDFLQESPTVTYKSVQSDESFSENISLENRESTANSFEENLSTINDSSLSSTENLSYITASINEENVKKMAEEVLEPFLNIASTGSSSDYPDFSSTENIDIYSKSSTNNPTVQNNEIFSTILDSQSTESSSEEISSEKNESPEDTTSKNASDGEALKESSTQKIFTEAPITTSKVVANNTTDNFVTVSTITTSPKNNKHPEYKIVLNISSSTTSTPSPDTTWALVSTLIPHKTTSDDSPNKDTNASNPSVPTSVDLVPKPVHGFGLEDSTSGLDPDVFQFAELCNELAFSFWSSVTTGISFARSVVVSPFATTSMLAMVFLGAKGSTSGEMNDILKLDDMVTFNPHAIFKNVIESIGVSKKSGVAVSVFIKELYSDKNKGKLLSFYKDRVKQFYDGHVEEVNFREINDVIRRRTNLLVKRQTWGKIPEFLKDNNLFVRPPLAAVSANIFQTDCSEASTEGRDGEIHFVVLPSIRQRKLIPIPAVVWRNNFLAGYDPGLDATAVAIGTKDSTVSTIFVIPGQQGISAPGDGLMRLENRLVENAYRQNAWNRLLRSLIPRPGLEVQIPRFSHKSIINATMALQRMGLKDLFNSHVADLKGLNGVAHEYFLSDIVQINTFATCGEGKIDESHHSEIYPATTNRSFRRIRKIQHTRQTDTVDASEEPRDYQRAFHDPLFDPSNLALPLHVRPRQARIPDAPRLRFDRPFLYFVRHNPTGLILHMGRFNPRLLP